MTRALTVWWEGAVVGLLALDRDGQMQFSYAPEWLRGGHTPALSVAAVEPRSVAGRAYLLVQRYDRRADQHGGVTRLHQEDFCQALGLLPHRTYAADGGPAAGHCFELVRRVCSQPAVELLKLLDAFLFHALIGNADAHGKNYSLLYRGAAVGLAPLYDLLSTVAYPELDTGFAMRIGGRRTLEELRGGDWDRFARTAGMGAPYVRRRVRELADRTRECAEPVAAELSLPGLSDKVLAGCAARTSKRAQWLAGTM